MTELTLYNYSSNYENKSFDERNLNKKISDLSLEDLNWCLRNRQFLHQVIDLVIEKVEENWEMLDKYYPTQICQWFDEAIQEIITIPFLFWESRIKCFEKICYFITALNKRPLKIEPKLIEMFLNHKPKFKSWTNEDSKKFLENIFCSKNLDIAGNLIEAIIQIREVKYAILSHQRVYIEPLYKSISTIKELYEFIREEYDEIGEDFIEDFIIQNGLEREKLISLTKTND